MRKAILGSLVFAFVALGQGVAAALPPEVPDPPPLEDPSDPDRQPYGVDPYVVCYPTC